ncbi:MAG: hypothetical protein FWG87_06860 [Defluviitaleaceae bacterium]|nr:hypothetical protein [Defluviitaleaceae bacterium]
MKKIVLGSMMMLAGVVSTAILLSGTMATGFTNNGQYSFAWSLSQYKLTTPLTAFIAIAVLGLALGVWGLVEKGK